jgi:hypothetical protein
MNCNMNQHPLDLVDGIYGAIRASPSERQQVQLTER